MLNEKAKYTTKKLLTFITELEELIPGTRVIRSYLSNQEFTAYFAHGRQSVRIVNELRRGIGAGKIGEGSNRVLIDCPGDLNIYASADGKKVSQAVDVVYPAPLTESQRAMITELVEKHKGVRWTDPETFPGHFRTSDYKSKCLSVTL